MALTLTACGKAQEDAAPGATTASSAPAADVSAAPAAMPAGVAFASLTGDAAKGQTIFNQCRACHAPVAGANGIGPSLFGVVGRTAGSVEGYAYSPANKGSGIHWTPDTIYTYLESPARMVPGTKMSFMLADPQARADVIAYLATLK